MSVEQLLELLFSDVASASHDVQKCLLSNRGRGRAPPMHNTEVDTDNYRIYLNDPSWSEC